MGRARKISSESYLEVKLMAENGVVNLVWYFHAPTVMSDENILDQVRECFKPLICLHLRLGVPVTIAATGAYLTRLHSIDPEAICLLRTAIAEDIVCVAGTFFYEIFPALIPVHFLHRHIRADVEIKMDLFGVGPRVFFPANFAWIPQMQRLLSRLGYRVVILDKQHFEISNSTQTWHWGKRNEFGPRIRMQRLPIDEDAVSKIYRTGSYNGAPELFCVFRDTDSVRDFSFGNNGFLHRPLDPAKQQSGIKDLLTKIKKGGVVTLADDGDRINPVSIPIYEDFLSQCRKQEFFKQKVADCASESICRSDQEVPFLPTFSLGDVKDFWFSDLDAVAYQRLLDEVAWHVQFGSLEVDDILELQDVYYFFWKNKKEKLYYVNRAIDLLSSVTDTPIVTGRPARPGTALRYPASSH